MGILFYISDFMIPVVVLIVILFGVSKKTPIYDTFVEGAKEGIGTVFQILPTLIGLMTAVSLLRASGALDILVQVLAPITDRIGFPGQLLPLSLMRLVSSSAALGMLVDIFQEFGTDSFLGRLGSTMMGCTETIFYTMSVYFLSIGIKDTRHTLLAAILANIAGIAASVWIVQMMFPG